MSDVVRIPEQALAGVPQFSFKPSYRKHDGLWLAHVDVGKGAPVIFVHGEPTWSFLWRKVIPPMAAAGFRCIAPDLPGFGRSDKPADVSWYSYDRHTASVAALIADLKLRDATVVGHEWGAAIALRLAAEQAERIDRVVVLSGGLFTGHQKMTDAWMAFRQLAQRSEDFPVAFLLRAGCKLEPGRDVIAAYEAPFPRASAKAGARAFPLNMPSGPDSPGARVAQRALETLRSEARPKLIIWGEEDRLLPLQMGRRFAHALGTDVDHVIAGASHFVPEDAGPKVGALIAEWLRSAAGGAGQRRRSLLRWAR